MSIKSTTTLRRSEALAMYFDLLEELKGSQLSNIDLGNALDELVELKCQRDDRTCFDNFLVVDDDDYDWRRDY